MTEDEMVGWHHQLNGQEFERTPRDGEGQRSLVYCSPQGCKELDTTEQMNNNNKEKKLFPNQKETKAHVLGLSKSVFQQMFAVGFLDIQQNHFSFLFSN